MTMNNWNWINRRRVTIRRKWFNWNVVLWIREWWYVCFQVSVLAYALFLGVKLAIFIYQNL